MRAGHGGAAVTRGVCRVRARPARRAIGPRGRSRRVRNEVDLARDARRAVPRPARRQHGDAPAFSNTCRLAANWAGSADRHVNHRDRSRGRGRRPRPRSRARRSRCLPRPPGPSAYMRCCACSTFNFFPEICRIKRPLCPPRPRPRPPVAAGCSPGRCASSGRHDPRCRVSTPPAFHWLATLCSTAMARSLCHNHSCRKDAFPLHLPIAHWAHTPVRALAYRCIFRGARPPSYTCTCKQTAGRKISAVKCTCYVLLLPPSCHPLLTLTRTASTRSQGTPHV